ncbi:peptide deformylase [Lacticaseibacillus mingshuiensis]|uniref:Peptide deformylase n=1 Tax=Lacticaseibacillus mingshuiensis TaxID=2799574 RepID=A0ABW4CHV4_9LACO|nr:peptide deformylase [Lacticaseibacillus mingshuiensis]
MKQQIMKDPTFLSQPAPATGLPDDQLAQNLVDTLLAHQDHCVGMAANMIGVNKAMIVLFIGVLPVVMVAPQIIKQSGRYETKEGCLSLLGERPATRYQAITVTFKDRGGVARTQAFSGFVAQVIQHECDHLAGKLI